MKVWVIRHGESETNQAGLWTGWLDVSLTEKGEKDAKLAGALLRGTDFDKIYASDLKRARQTAEIALPGCRYEMCEALREINVGDIAGKPLGVVKVRVGKPTGDDGYACFGGESRTEFNARIATFMQGLEALDHENVAIFSHAGWLRGALDFVLGMNVSRQHVCCGNCAVAIFEYKDSVWKLHSWINLQ